MTDQPQQPPSDDRPGGTPGAPPPGGAGQPGEPPTYGQQPGAAPYGQQPGAAPPPPYGQQPGYQGAPQYSGGGAAPAGELSPSDQRLWSILAHIGGIFFSFIAPLVIWLVFKDRGRYVKEQSAEALNFQLTVLIAVIVSSILTVIFIGILMLFAVGVVALIFMILAAVAASRGENYRYPVNLRMVK